MFAGATCALSSREQPESLSNLQIAYRRFYVKPTGAFEFPRFLESARVRGRRAEPP